MGKTSLLADYVSASYFFAVLLTALPLITRAARTRDSAVAFFLSRSRASECVLRAEPEREASSSWPTRAREPFVSAFDSL